MPSINCLTVVVYVKVLLFPSVIRWFPTKRNRSLKFIKFSSYILSSTQPVCNVPSVADMKRLISFIFPVFILKTVEAATKHSCSKYFYPMQACIRYGVKLFLCGVPRQEVWRTGGMGPQIFNFSTRFRWAFGPPDRVNPSAWRKSGWLCLVSTFGLDKAVGR
jgi:hypothetical protein